MDVKLHDNSALRSWFFLKKKEKVDESAKEAEKERLVRWEGLFLASEGYDWRRKESSASKWTSKRRLKWTIGLGS